MTTVTLVTMITLTVVTMETVTLVTITTLTLVRSIMTGYIVAGKHNGGYKYGGIAEKPPNLTAIIKRTKVHSLP